MTQSELIDILAIKHTHLNSKDVEFSVKVILEYMVQILSSGEWIEIKQST